MRDQVHSAVKEIWISLKFGKKARKIPESLKILSTRSLRQQDLLPYRKMYWVVVDLHWHSAVFSGSVS
jgi:hypothetical protein